MFCVESAKNRAQAKAAHRVWVRWHWPVVVHFGRMQFPRGACGGTDTRLPPGQVGNARRMGPCKTVVARESRGILSTPSSEIGHDKKISATALTSSNRSTGSSGKKKQARASFCMHVCTYARMHTLLDMDARSLETRSRVCIDESDSKLL